MSTSRGLRGVARPRSGKVSRNFVDASKGMGWRRRAMYLEPLEQRRLLAADFGDAPLPYPVLIAENGAQHSAVGPTLGAMRDMEANGVHSAAATGDGADEDGVSFGTIQVGQLDASLTVTVQGGVARLDAWIDFNRDGSWGGPMEQIADNQSVAVGNNAITFDVPSTAIDGQTISRFRLSTAGNLGVRGAATDGEVEDYAVTIASPALTLGAFGGQNTIDVTADGAASVFAADVDGDGDTDALSASYDDDTIAWHENNGSQVFSERTISTAADGAISVVAADVDGDGDLDVLSASWHDDTIAWYENNGSHAFTERTISTTTNGARSVVAADVDGDGDLDVLSASYFDDTIAWYENNGSQTFTKRTISSTANGARSVFAADVDGDGDLDVLSASFYDDTIAWHENNGSQVFTKRTITTTANGAESVFAADVDRDGDMDALSASRHDDTIAWYENNGSQTFTKRPINMTADGAFSVFAADVDGDGDVDVLSASLYDDTIAWFENNGSQTFTKRTIITTADGAIREFVADVDGDGDLDVLSASAYDDAIAWYDNISAPQVEAVTVAGSGSQHPPYDLPAGSGEQLRTVPVGGLDRISIRFNLNVTLASGDLTISGLSIPSYAVLGFSYDSANFIATWTLAAPVSADELTLTLADAVNFAGAALDGDWTNPANLTDHGGSDFPTGNGNSGGDFVFRLTVLPGDANRDNRVTGADFTIWGDHFDNGVGAADDLFADGDFTGEGFVTGADFTIWADNFGIDFTAAAFPSAGAEVAGESRVDPVGESPEPTLAPPTHPEIDTIPSRLDVSGFTEFDRRPWFNPARARAARQRVFEQWSDPGDGLHAELACSWQEPAA